jgi:PilZ domain
VDSRRRISARQVVEDIRCGTAVMELLQKYKLTSNELRRLLDKLLHSRLLDQRELDSWSTLNHEITVIRGIRQDARITIEFPLKVQDCGHPYKQGIVRDLSQKGIGVLGIKVRVGETRTLVVRLNGIADCTSVRFEAKCRWVIQTEAEGQECIAGFEITGIEDAALNELRKVLGR